MLVFSTVWMDLYEFEEIVVRELDLLPADLSRLLENVEVIVEDWPNSEQAASVSLGLAETLYGLYEGIPRTARGVGYSMVLPDRITVFRGPILRAHRTPAAVREQVRQTVVHEIAHHFGIDDDRLVDLGAY